MELFGSAWSRLGRRSGNEDSFHVDNELEFYAVSDGMGGAAGGELASRMAIDAVANHLSGRESEVAAFSAAGDTDGAAQLLREAVVAACGFIHARAKSDVTLDGMGATFTAFLRIGMKAVLAHVGDSRLYLARDGRAHQLSQDHTFVAELLRVGAIEPSQAASHPYRHMITRALGTQPAVLVDTLTVDLMPGDRLLLCSDGFSGYVTDSDWLAGQLVADEPATVAEELARFADEAGGRDNITVLVVSVGEYDPAVDTQHGTEEAQLSLGFLRRIPAFRALSLAQLARVFDACESRSYAAGTTVQSKGSASDRLFVVLRGALTLDVDDHKLVVGDRSSLIPLLRPLTSRADVIAAEDTLLLELRYDSFRALTRRRPYLGVRLMHELAAAALDEASKATSAF